MQIFSPYHFFWLLITIIFVVGCYRMGIIHPDSVLHQVFRFSLFILVGVNETAWFLYRHHVAEIPVANNLPLHLCDISVFLMFYTLVSKRSWTGELSYFMGAVGALLAVCMPAISETGNIRLIAEIRYFITHIALVGVGVYFTFGCRCLPSYSAIWRSYGFVHAYALLITPVNFLLGTNYFYTISAPQQLSFLFVFPHWLFLIGASLIFLTVFNLLYVPFIFYRQ